MFVSEAHGQWSGSPRGREHFARLGLTCVALRHPITILIYGDILECTYGMWGAGQGGRMDGRFWTSVEKCFMGWKHIRTTLIFNSHAQSRCSFSSVARTCPGHGVFHLMSPLCDLRTN